MRLVSVVLPCRDEGANVPRVVAAVRSALGEAGVDYEFLVVDDGSEDATWEAVEAAAREDAKAETLRVQIADERAEGLADAAALREAVRRSLLEAARGCAAAGPYRLKLTIDGLHERDRLVFEACRAAAVPVVVTMAGGYARDIDAIVTIHANTVAEARRLSTREGVHAWL